MSWSYKVKQINDEFHAVIFDNELNKVVIAVDNLSKEFIETLVTLHNKSIDNCFRDGIEEGKEIMEQVFNLK